MFHSVKEAVFSFFSFLSPPPALVNPCSSTLSMIEMKPAIGSFFLHSPRDHPHYYLLFSPLLFPVGFFFFSLLSMKCGLPFLCWLVCFLIFRIFLPVQPGAGCLMIHNPLPIITSSWKRSFLSPFPCFWSPPVASLVCLPLPCVVRNASAFGFPQLTGSFPLLVKVPPRQFRSYIPPQPPRSFNLFTTISSPFPFPFRRKDSMRHFGPPHKRFLTS